MSVASLPRNIPLKIPPVVAIAILRPSTAAGIKGIAIAMASPSGSI